ncbi:MAG: hypothetical protein ACYCYC_12480, partial [Bellilinea sp.]
DLANIDFHFFYAGCDWERQFHDKTLLKKIFGGWGEFRLTQFSRGRNGSSNISHVLMAVLPNFHVTTRC